MSIRDKRDAKHKRVAAANKAAWQLEEDLYWAVVDDVDWDFEDNHYEGYNSTDELPYGGN